MSKNRRNIADALAMPGIADIEFEPPRVIIETRPADVKVPNATTKKAIAELEAGKGKKFVSVVVLMADLNDVAEKER